MSRAKSSHEGSPAYWFPRDRVAAIIERQLHEFRAARSLQKGNSQGGQFTDKNFIQPIEYLIEKTGIPEKTLRRIINGPPPSDLARGAKGEHVHIDNVDKIFTALHCVHYFYLPPEQGGLSDHYFHRQVLNPDEWEEERKERARVRQREIDRKWRAEQRARKEAGKRA